MNLQNNYSREDFLDFIKVFIPNFKKDIRKVNNNGLKSSKEVYYLGESPDLDLAVFEITHTSSSDARVSLATDGFRIMKDSANYRALVVYKPTAEKDWRLSLMTAVPDTTEKGKVALKYSNPRRYSFFLGENAKVNTPNRFLIKQGVVKNFDDLQNRFSLEVVNKEFYRQISESFIRLVGGTLGTGQNEKKYKALLHLPSISEHNQLTMEFGVRLIGRVIFCWFLREKKSIAGEPLMPKSLLSHNAIEKHPDYYHQVLEPIFFEVLNKPTTLRKDTYLDKPFSLIPYLNGGLFSPHEGDYYKRRGGEPTIYQNTLIVPDEWIRDLFQILETYNFTIDENTSFDEELSIDPEMLGKIFENLLAEINPETGESARKSTGSYYTPRVIVDYMVDESLLTYLNQRTNINEEKLRAIISYDLADDTEYPLSETEKQKLINAIEKIKILDPACGSGAFPIGALQKIVFVLQRIDPQGQFWFKKQLQKTPPELRRKLEREHKYQNFDYIRKLGIIRENIYGVDIQPIATEIARLRCFLTLVVDQYVDDGEENRGVEPLPNLDFKFVTANSLIGLPDISLDVNDGITQTDMFDDTKKIEDLKDIRDQYFNSSGVEREQLKTDFVTAQKRLIEQLIKEHGYMGVAKAELTKKLTDWEPFSPKPSGWFDAEWMFGVKGGFDVVIANPPYVDSETMVKEQNDLRELYKSLFSTARGNWDLYIPFLELGFNLLSELGTACFITPNKWFAIGYGEEIRKKLVDGIFRVGNCNSIKVFEAGNSPVITLYQRGNGNEYVSVDKYNEEYQIETSVKVNKAYLSPNLGLLLSSQLPLVVKIRSQQKIVGDFYKAENPCTVSEAYEIKNILTDYYNEQKDLSFFRFVNTGTIDSFVSLWGVKPTTYLKSKYKQPVILKHDFKNKFPKRYQQMVQPKLIISGMRHFESFLDEKGEFVAGKSTEILIQKSDLNLRIVLGLLNSTVIRFYIKEVYGVLGIDGGINFTTDLINELPFPDTLIDGNLELEKLVEKVITITRDGDFFQHSTKQAEVKDFQNQIDKLVFELFNLTSEETDTVVGKNK